MVKTSRASYRIEVLDRGRWVAAPGESTGWTKAAARRAMAAGMPTMNGLNDAWDAIRLVNETTGLIVDLRLGPRMIRFSA